MEKPSPEFVHLLEQYTESTIAQEMWRKEHSAISRTFESHERSRGDDRIKQEALQESLYRAEDTIQRLTDQLATANDAISFLTEQLAKANKSIQEAGE